MILKYFVQLLLQVVSLKSVDLCMWVKAICRASCLQDCNICIWFFIWSSLPPPLAWVVLFHLSSWSSFTTKCSTVDYTENVTFHSLVRWCKRTSCGSQSDLICNRNKITHFFSLFMYQDWTEPWCSERHLSYPGFRLKELDKYLDQLLWYLINFYIPLLFLGWEY